MLTLSNSTSLISLQRPYELWPESRDQDEDLSTIKDANGKGVIPGDLPTPAGQCQDQEGQPRVQLQTRINLPSKDFCLNRTLPHLNLVMEFEEEEAQVIKIDLHKTPKSLPQPPQENPFVKETLGSEDDIVDISSPSFMTPPPSPNRNGNQVTIPLQVNGTHSPPPGLGQGQPRFQVQTTIKMPNKAFCLVRALPDLNLVIQFDFDDEEAQVLRIELHQLLRSLPHPPPQKGLSSDQPSIVLSEMKPRHRPLPRNKDEVPAIRVKGPHHNKAKEIRLRPGYRYLCIFCHQRFYDPYNLNRHVLSHTGEKPYSCDTCGKQFNRKDRLARHRRLHDPATRPSFPCEECGRNFTYKHHMNKHKELVHRREKEIQ